MTTRRDTSPRTALLVGAEHLKPLFERHGYRAIAVPNESVAIEYARVNATRAVEMAADQIDVVVIFPGSAGTMTPRALWHALQREPEFFNAVCILPADGQADTSAVELPALDKKAVEKVIAALLGAISRTVMGFSL